MSENKKPFEEFDGDLMLGLPDDDDEFSDISENDEFAFMLPIDDDDEELDSTSKKKSEIKAEKKEKNKKSDVKKTREKVKKISRNTPCKAEKEKTEAIGVKQIFTITLKLLLICAVAAMLLALVYNLTAPVIEQNELEKKQAAINEIFPVMTGYETVQSDISGVDALHVVKLGDEIQGYCAEVSPSGFGGKVNMLVGVGMGKCVIGVTVISHSETSGVGTKALDGAYLSGYIGLGGLSLDSIVLNSDIDAVARATVTSKAVNTGINTALSAYEMVFGNTNSSVEVSADE